MRIKKVFFITEDGVELCGLLHEPENRTEDIVIAVHGMQSNCLKKRDDIIANKLTEQGISYFCFNNRGHDLVNNISQIHNTNKIKRLCGSCLENIEDSYYDIKAAILAMVELGYKKVHLQGHSLGCTKIVYTYNKMKENNNLEIINKIKSVILLSMVDIPNAMGFFFTGDKENIIKYMQKEVNEGSGDTLISSQNAIIPMSPNTFLKYLQNNTTIDFARYGDEEYSFPELNNIKVPLFMRWGNNNELIIQDADKLILFLKDKIKNENLDINFIDGSTHNYSGKEEILANQILNFLDGVEKNRNI